MKFGRRLGLFLVGAFFGVLLAGVFFQDRLHLFTSWLPNNRVLLRLQMTEALYTPEALCQLQCLGLDTADVSTVKSQGDVRFRESHTRTDPKVYVVDQRLNDELVRMTFIAGDSTTTLSEVAKPYVAVHCDCGEEKSSF